MEVEPRYCRNASHVARDISRVPSGNPTGDAYLQGRLILPISAQLLRRLRAQCESHRKQYGITASHGFRCVIPCGESENPPIVLLAS
jgi:hypothetical protein